MTTKPLYVGIDLGTTNSAVAVYDGERVTVIRNAQGGSLTPSVVRIDARGAVTAGAKARRLLESDPANTRAEFKRLMGTTARIAFPAAKQDRAPEELAAEVLKALRADVRDQIGVAPTRAVISVPALFELPQSRATSEAARLAGFEKVELVQEPIASALAAGWTAEMEPGPWLVYDIGGGTFDVSLLETSEGFLRVVDHDGDNYLGGRDLDWAIVDFAIGKIREETGVAISRSDPACALAVKKLKAAAEEAKIEAARGATTSIVVPALAEGVDADVPLDPETLTELARPLVERTLAVCQRLLERHRLAPTALRRVVLVGGPTAMPLFRSLVAAALVAPFAEGVDPMTIVAEGAALFAASAGLDGRSEIVAKSARRGLLLRFPAVSPDVEANVVGRVADAAAKPKIEFVRFVRTDGWSSAATAVSQDGSFLVRVQLLRRRATSFTVEALAAGGAVDVTPAEITITQGVTLGDPPLSRTIGVALANNTVHVYFARGTPLPARGVFTHRTVEPLSPTATGTRLTIPIVQGELAKASLCRLVGAIEIAADALPRLVPAGADVEVTIDLDRGGRLQAKAFVPSIDRVFEDVAKLCTPAVPVDELANVLRGLRERLSAARAAAFRKQQGPLVKKLAPLDRLLDETERDVGAAQGGDADAAERARRTLLDVEGDLSDAEGALRFDEMSADAAGQLANAMSWISELGTAAEQSLFQELARSAQEARRARNEQDLDVALRRIRAVSHAAYFRHPDAWSWEFDAAEARLHSASKPAEAASLASAGREARARGDRDGLERATRKLWALLPPDEETRRLGHGSGLR